MQFMKRRGLYEASRIVYIPIHEIIPNPGQPRRHFDPDGLRELSGSIARYGILQPLSVRRRDGGFELVSGERRLRAAKMAGLTEAPCIILDVNGPESSVLALVENLQRRDLDFIEEAEGLARLVNIHGFSQEEAARRVGKSQSAVANKLRILKLPKDLLYVIRQSGLTERHARALLRLNNNEERVAVLGQVIRQGLNVSKTEAFIDAYLERKKKGLDPEPPQKAGRHTYVLKDVRLFLNSIYRNMDIMKEAGISAECGKEETDSDIILTIRIPKKPV
jgi:ParB family chromosome partitioning protein